MERIPRHEDLPLRSKETHHGSRSSRLGHIGFNIAAVSATAQHLDTLDAPAETSRPELVLQAIGFGPVGEFRDNASFSFGGAVGCRYFVDQRGLVALYGRLGFAQYGRESWSLFGFDDTTTTMFFVEVGPQIHIGRGPIVPYIHRTVGFARIATVSSVDFLDEDLLSETDASDNNSLLAGGGGFHIRAGTIFPGFGSHLSVQWNDDLLDRRRGVRRQGGRAALSRGIADIMALSFFINRKEAEQ